MREEMAGGTGGRHGGVGGRCCQEVAAIGAALPATASAETGVRTANHQVQATSSACSGARISS
jgi:hypothetical protein